MDRMVKVGVAGAGVFGTYHAQKAAASARAELVGVYDASSQRSAKVTKQFGGKNFTDYEQLLDECNAVIIAVPATFHQDYVEQALTKLRHVLVEKPLTMETRAARVLAGRAVTDDLVLQVGHQERFVAKAMGVLAIEEHPLVVESVRAGPLARNGRAGDVSVIWDLMIHDLDLAACLIANKFESVTATGKPVKSNFIDEAEAEFTYVGGAKARLRASRVAKARERTMKLIYEQGEISVDFLTRQLTNTTPYDVHVDIASDLPDPLGRADEYFFAACLGERDTPVPGHGTIGAVSMAEAAEADILSKINSSHQDT